ncbi:hypothetical protein ILUMI_03379 [Ignelater luminosus]|uniref:PiggyBac transposable element-derived protein domain-containing protein n=1 Tax=Ignelater luminosus TaxID=2038154 RepID=A0A8K0DGF9_IGNLU|nr:hypothetical protein ILUMI_03379 [Ignelater luminosus]
MVVETNRYGNTEYRNGKIFRSAVMDGFELLLATWHFSDNDDPSLENDRLRKLSPLIRNLVQKYQDVYIPDQKLCIDETIVPFRGRLRFRQYMKNKKLKFGIKAYKLCCDGGYMYNLQVYCGSDCVQGGQASANVVFSLMAGLFSSGRQLYTDNYYTSVSLATELLDKTTHLIGTLTSNRKYNPKEVVQKKLKAKEVFAQENEAGIVVLMLSTVHKDDLKQVKQRGGKTDKPEVVVDYNQAKTFIDILDQIKSYSHCLLRGTKWYRKLAIKFLLGSEVVNAHLVYKEVTNDKISMTEV